jgi:hypothetical protein
MEMVTNRLDFSARTYTRLLKVARTFTDLAESDQIQQSHLAEARPGRIFWGWPLVGGHDHPVDFPPQSVMDVGQGADNSRKGYLPQLSRLPHRVFSIGKWPVGKSTRASVGFLVRFRLRRSIEYS